MELHDAIAGRLPVTGDTRAPRSWMTALLALASAVQGVEAAANPEGRPWDDPSYCQIGRLSGYPKIALLGDALGLLGDTYKEIAAHYRMRRGVDEDMHRGNGPPAPLARDLLDDLREAAERVLGIVEPAAAVAQGAQGDGPSTTVTEAEHRVLRRIADSDILLKGPDAIADVAERRGRDALKDLERRGLIHRPRGLRKGYAATQAGVEYLSRKRPKSAT
jgi:hypothetical protein